MNPAPIPTEPLDDPKAEGLAQALAQAGGERPFQHDGLIFWFVPVWVLRAYAAARLARAPGPAILRACVLAHIGQRAWVEYSGHEDWIMWRVGRAWAARCGVLERRVRGMAGDHTSVAA